MKNKKKNLAALKWLLVALVLGVILLVICLGRKTEDFSCYTYDGKGNPIKGFYAKEEDTWYLFVTSNQEIKDLKLKVQGEVEQTSAGTISQEKDEITGAFTKSEDSVELTMAGGQVVHIVAMQSNLPSVYIDLNGTTLETIHGDKDAKHTGNSIYIQDATGTLNFGVENTVEIKGRGNSSWREYEKKGYQIKFLEKTSLMGMPAEKKWVLLANSSDDSMMRTQLVYHMADDLDMDFVPEFQYVDLWIEGEYLGTYMLGEKVEQGANRLDLDQPTGALFEHDEAFYAEEPYWFYSDALGRHFTVKEIVQEEEQVIAEAMRDFEVALEEVMMYLYSTPSEDVTLEQLSEMIDVDSFVKYYLINEYTLNCESYATSFYWYKDGAEDVIHLGPIWDFDTCMGIDGRGSDESYGTNHVLFQYLMAAPAFYNRTVELTGSYRENLTGMTQEVDVLLEELEASAKMNYIRWDVLGTTNPKSGLTFAPSYQEAADNLRGWLKGREEGFVLTSAPVVTSIVSDDYYKLDIRYFDGADYENMTFAVIGKVDNKDTAVWCVGTQDESGVWHATADLGTIMNTGIYYIHAYANDQEMLVADGRNYIAEVPPSRYPITTQFTEEGLKLLMELEDTIGDLEAVQFVIWGAQSGEESARLVDATRSQNNRWSATISLCQLGLKSAETLVIHAYGRDFEYAANRWYLNNAEAVMTRVIGHTEIDDGNHICAICGLSITLAEQGIQAKPVYRLYRGYNGQYFYTSSRAELDAYVAEGWRYEGIAWYAPAGDGVPVYRLVNLNTGRYHYTMSMEEIDLLMKAGWGYEKECWKSAYTGTALYRMWDPIAQGHYYAVSEKERDELISQGWNYEGIAWYGVVVD